MQTVDSVTVSESVFKTSDNRLGDPEESKSKQHAQTKLPHTSHCLPITVAPKGGEQSAALQQE